MNKSPMEKAPTGVPGEEAARLLADADSFLRLGLVEQAIEHLEGALRRDPALRAVREALVKLYVMKRRNKGAIAELWALVTSSEDPQQQIRYLRYIIRL